MIFRKWLVASSLALFFCSSNFAVEYYKSPNPTLLFDWSLISESDLKLAGEQTIESKKEEIGATILNYFLWEIALTESNVKIILRNLLSAFESRQIVCSFVDPENARSSPPLHLSVLFDPQLAVFFLEEGLVDARQTDKKGRTAIHYVVGNIANPDKVGEIVTTLVSYGCDLLAEDIYGRRAIDYLLYRHSENHFVPVWRPQNYPKWSRLEQAEPNLLRKHKIEWGKIIAENRAAACLAIKTKENMMARKDVEATSTSKFCAFHEDPLRACPDEYLGLSDATDNWILEFFKLIRVHG